MSFLRSVQAFTVAVSSAAEVAGAAVAEAAGVGGVAGFSALGCGSQADIAITAAMARPLRTNLVRCIDVSPMIFMPGPHATSHVQAGSID
jgi:hypothetical protein